MEAAPGPEPVPDTKEPEKKPPPPAAPPPATADETPAAIAFFGTAQWGLTSLLLELTLLVFFPISMIAILVMHIDAGNVRDSWDLGGRVSATVISSCGVALYNGAALFGLVFSVGGLIRAVSRKHPQAIHIGATVIGLFVMLGGPLLITALICVLIFVW
jgi:hypothetical protein